MVDTRCRDERLFGVWRQCCFFAWRDAGCRDGNTGRELSIHASNGKNFNTLGAKGKVNYEMKNVGSLFMNHDLFDEVHELLARDFDELNRKYGN